MALPVSAPLYKNPPDALATSVKFTHSDGRRNRTDIMHCTIRSPPAVMSKGESRISELRIQSKNEPTRVGCAQFENRIVYGKPLLRIQSYTDAG